MDSRTPADVVRLLSTQTKTRPAVVPDRSILLCRHSLTSRARRLPQRAVTLHTSLHEASTRPVVGTWLTQAKRSIVQVADNKRLQEQYWKLLNPTSYVKQGKKNFILVPVAFVNEHIETLHEMDIEYAHDLGKELGVKICRAAAPNDHPLFIDALTDVVSKHLAGNCSVGPKFLTRCPHCTNARCEKSKAWFTQICARS